MCLGHVYIVLEPIGSARLMFDDDLYYELCVLVIEDCSESRVDHGHDEESRNGRVVKIDILGNSIRTLEWFWNGSGIFRSTGRLPEVWNPPGEVMGHMGHRGEARQPTRGWLPPPHGESELDKGRGRGPPFLLLPLSFPLSPSGKRKGGAE